MLPSIWVAVAILVPIMSLLRFCFSWLRAPIVAFILGKTTPLLCGPACRRCGRNRVDVAADAKAHYEVSGSEEEEEHENEIVEAMIAKLQNRFTPLHLEVNQINGLQESPAKIKVVLVSAVFKKVAAEAQRASLVAAARMPRLNVKLNQRSTIIDDVIAYLSAMAKHKVDLSSRAGDGS